MQRQAILDGKNLLLRLAVFLTKILDELPLDATADAMACNFMHSRVPPVLGQRQKQLCESGQGLLTAGSRVRIVREGVARITLGETELGSRAFLHHIMDNSSLCKEKPLSFFDFPLCYAPALDLLIESYPRYVLVSELSFDPEEEEGDEGDEPSVILEMQLELANMLFSAGLLQLKPPKHGTVFKKPLVSKKLQHKRKPEGKLELPHKSQAEQGSHHLMPPTNDSAVRRKGSGKSKKRTKTAR